MGRAIDSLPKLLFCLQGFRLCGGDKRAMKTGEVCDRPLETFGLTLSYLTFIESFLVCVPIAL